MFKLQTQITFIVRLLATSTLNVITLVVSPRFQQCVSFRMKAIVLETPVNVRPLKSQTAISSLIRMLANTLLEIA